MAPIYGCARLTVADWKRTRSWVEHSQRAFLEAANERDSGKQLRLVSAATAVHSTQNGYIGYSTALDTDQDECA